MRKLIVWAMFSLLFLIALSGCGRSSTGSTPDSMTITTLSQGTTTTTIYTEGPYSTTSAGHSFLNPSLDSYVDALNEATIEFRYWDGVSPGTTVSLNMHINGNTPGLYTVCGLSLTHTSIAYAAYQESFTDKLPCRHFNQRLDTDLPKSAGQPLTWGVLKRG